MNMPPEKSIIVDIDGTLADNRRRQHFVEKDVKNWEAFFADMDNDPAFQWCLEIIKGMHAKNYRIIFVTGRSDDFLTRTIVWIQKHLPEHKDFLIFTRASGDHRLDTVVKEEIYRKHIENKFNVLFCLDDRPSVCRMWRSIGLTVLQCNDREF